jgi:hypothetical protein
MVKITAALVIFLATFIIVPSDTTIFNVNHEYNWTDYGACDTAFSLGDNYRHELTIGTCLGDTPDVFPKECPVIADRWCRTDNGGFTLKSGKRPNTYRMVDGETGDVYIEISYQ